MLLNSRSEITKTIEKPSDNFFFLIMEDRDLRVVLHFLWLKELPNKDITEELNNVYGEGTISLKTVQKWTKRFNDGHEGFDDYARSGRPKSDELIPIVAHMLEKEPFLSQKKIAKALGVHPTTVHRILTEELELTRVNFRWIPHTLNDAQKAKRVEVAKILLKMLANATLAQLRLIITGDETWVYFSNPRSSMWVGSDIPRPEKPKLTIGSKKVMITVFWSPVGMYLIEMLSPGERFTKQYFIDEILAKLYNRICNTRPKKKTEDVFLHFDNARPHLVDDILDQMEFTRLPHPPFSPDLAPTDFFLFGYMKHLLEGKEFESPEHLYSEVTKILQSIQKAMLQDAYLEWINRLRKCIELGGKYVH
jgi:histone-lysine N-methyltransferase SETMAR